MGRLLGLPGAQHMSGFESRRTGAREGRRTRGEQAPGQGCSAAEIRSSVGDTWSVPTAAARGGVALLGLRAQLDSLRHW